MKRRLRRTRVFFRLQPEEAVWPEWAACSMEQLPQQRGPDAAGKAVATAPGGTSHQLGDDSDLESEASSCWDLTSISSWNDLESCVSFGGGGRVSSAAGHFTKPDPYHTIFLRDAEWSYRGEGGANLVLSLENEKTVVRFTKSKYSDKDHDFKVSLVISRPSQPRRKKIGMLQDSENSAVRHYSCHLFHVMFFRFKGSLTTPTM